jgi:hypothetical protein
MSRRGPTRISPSPWAKLLLATAGLAGCHPATTSTPVPRIAAKPVVAAPAGDSAEAAPATSPDAEGGDDSPQPANGADEIAAPDAAASAIASAGGAAKEGGAVDAAVEPAPAERVAILTPGGPLLVDVRMTLDGKPVGAALARLVDDVLAAADSDGDGRPTWQELSENNAFLDARMPQPRQSGSMLLKDWSDKHDVNRDGRVQPDEAASWLGRDSGRTARSFALRTSRAFSPDPRTTSRMWPLLDVDRDGRLSTAEIDGAAQRLWLRDADDDRVIELSELASLRDQLNAAAGMRTEMRTNTGSASARLAALHLEPKSDLERVDYVLQDMYAPLQDLAPSSFAALPRLFAQLDEDGDDWLQRDELASLRTVPAHVEVVVSIESASQNGGAPQASLHVTSRAEEIVALPAAMRDRVVLSLGKTRIVLAVQDLTRRPEVAGESAPPESDAYADATASLQETQVRLVVHDESDAVFDELDANCDGRLGEREIATAPARLLRYDANGDGQLAADETPYEMIVAFVRGESLGERSYSTPPSVAMSAAEGAPEWFGFADLNHDGDVSRREFLGTVEQFAALDADGDGFVTAPEATSASEPDSESAAAASEGSAADELPVETATPDAHDADPAPPSPRL